MKSIQGTKTEQNLLKAIVTQFKYKIKIHFIHFYFEISPTCSIFAPQNRNFNLFMDDYYAENMNL